MQIARDVRYALRLFRRSPGFTAIAVLSIALATGATAVVFAAIKAVVIEPLPFARPAELVQLRSEYPKMTQQSNGDWVYPNDIRELRDGTRTLGPLGAYRNAVFDLAGDSNTPPEALYGVLVNADLFRVLGVSPMLGRNILFGEDQPEHPGVILLSHGLWERRFHSDRSVIGRIVTINGQPWQVIGVMPEDFNFPMRREAAHTPEPYVEFWAAPFVAGANPNAGLGAVARLRRGASLNEAREELASVSRTLAHDFPALNRDRVLTANLLRDRTIGTAGKRLWLLMGAALVFMLIGCANVANLLLARGLKRQREIAVRIAIGAERSQIVRQLLTESCVLAALGGIAGYALAAAAWKILPSIAPETIPRLSAARADSSVLGFAIALAVLNGILFGILPALRMAASNAFSTRGAASARRGRVRFSLVVAEVALSVVLVVTGGQMFANFVRMLNTDPGFEADHVLASVVLPELERYRTPDQRALFYRKILDAVRALPGVEAAGTVDALPFSGENHGGSVRAGVAPPLVAEIDITGGDYLEAMGVRLVEGRWFREEEMSASNDSAIVSTFVARRLWPGRSAVGEPICVDCTPEHPNRSKRVIGVAANASHRAIDEPASGNVYLAAGAMQAADFLIVRTARPQGEMEKAIRRAIAAIDPNQPVLLSVSMRDLMRDSIADRRFMTALLAATGWLALLLAAAGVYGVVSCIASQRTQEIGVRIALGARPRDVLALVFREGMAMAGLGVAAGLFAALLLERWLRGVLADLGSVDPWLAAMAVTLVLGTTALACLIPARRATRVDPLSALRQE